MVAFILPNLPETHFTIWRGGGHRRRQSLAGSGADGLLRAANARLVVTLAPTPGTDLWPKLASQLDALPGVRQVLWVSMAPYVGGLKGLALRWMARRAKSAQRRVPIADLRALMRRQPHTHLKSGRQIHAEQRSSYFCTGGTTGLPKIAARTHGSEVFNAWAMASNMQPACAAR